MKKKQIKKNVNDAFNNETPDFLLKIKTECKNRRQIEPTIYEVKEKKSFTFNLIFKKLAFCVIACALFIAGVFVGNVEPTTQVAAKEASIYLDVNPSIEIQVDEYNKVIECLAGNDDGVRILENINLEGVGVETALYAIVGSMYANGYLNIETNSILVSVESYTTNDIILLDEISKQIDNVFKDNEEMECSIIAQKINQTDDLKDLAEEYNISIGKMQLIEKIIAGSELYTLDNIEELSVMSIHELDLIYQSLNVKSDGNEIISGKPGGFIENNEALEQVLKILDLSINDIQWHDVIALYNQNEFEERKMVFLVTVMLNGETEKIKYIVDCTNGEIMPEDTLDQWKDRLPNDGHFGETKDQINEGGPN